jgi:hypothetical protein
MPLMLDLEDSPPQSMQSHSMVEVTLSLREVRVCSTCAPKVNLFHVTHVMFLGDDEKVLIWDVAARKRKHTIEDSGHRWGQITCLSWLENRQDNELAVLAFGTARGYIVMFKQSRTEVGSCF